MKYKQNPAAEPSIAEENVEIKQRSKGTLSDKMIELLLRQLGHELYNHNLYRSFAIFFGTQGLQVLENYYIDRSEEEKHHHDWVYQYLSDCDACIIYPQIPAIEEEGSDNVTPFELTVDAEIKTTMLINEMVDQALEEKDGTTFNGLMADNDKTGRLVREQNEEEMISRTALDIACSDATWLRKEKSIMAAFKGNSDEEDEEDDD